MPLTYVRTHCLGPSVAMLIGIAFAPAVVSEGGAIFDRLYPVTVDWKPTRVWVDGNDLMLKGTMVKRRCSCKYVPPPRARDAAGQNYGVTSESPTQTTSWTCAGEPQRFGPWRVHGAAGQDLEMFQEHQCSSLWTSFTPLGRVRAP